MIKCGFMENQNINKVDLFHLNYHVIMNNETYVYDQLHNVCTTKFRINWSLWQQPVATVEGRLCVASLTQKYFTASVPSFSHNKSFAIQA